MVREALKAADDLSRRENVELEVIDPRTIVPLDMETIVSSVRKTRTAVVLNEAPRQGSFAACLASEIEKRHSIGWTPRSSRWECNIRPFRSLRSWRKS